MNTQEYLNKFGVSIEAARGFVFANIGNPLVIYQAAKQYGITNAMLGEIAGNYSVAQVQGFFAAYNIDSTDLDDNQGGGSAEGPSKVLLNDFIDVNYGGMRLSGFDDGAYNIVIDVTQFKTYTDEQGVERVKNSYSFYLYGFGADDTLVVYKPARC